MSWRGITKTDFFRNLLLLIGIAVAAYVPVLSGFWVLAGLWLMYRLADQLGTLVKFKQPSLRWLFGLSTLLAMIFFLGGFLVLFWKVSFWTSWSGVMFLSACAAFVASKHQKPAKVTRTQIGVTWKNSVVIGAFLGVSGLLLLANPVVGQYTTTGWSVLPTGFWVIVWLGVAMLSATFVSKETEIASPARLWLAIGFATVLHFIVFAAFRAGHFGADPWRHLAMQKFIETGAVLPPTDLPGLLELTHAKLVNSGFWGAIPLISHIINLPSEMLNRLLPPLMTALVTGISFYMIGRKIFETSERATFFTLIALLSPALILQGNLANSQTFGIVFTILTLAVWLSDVRYRYLVSLVIGMAALLSYPPVGLFAFAFVILMYGVERIHRPALQVAAVLVGSVVPLALVAAGDVFSRSPEVSIPKFSEFLQAIAGQFSWTEQGILHMLLLVALIIFIRRDFQIGKVFLPWVIWSLTIPMLFRFISGNFLLLHRTLAVEQLTIAILASAAIILAILVLCGLRPWRGNPLIIAVFALVAAYLVQGIKTMPLTGWSISPKERAAIEAVEADAQGEPYLVLTDETTAAAGIAYTGYNLKHHTYYWYPGGPVSNYSTQIATTPSVQVIEQACTVYNDRYVYVITSPIPPFAGKASREKIEAAFNSGPIVQYSDATAVFKFACPTE